MIVADVNVIVYYMLSAENPSLSSLAKKIFAKKPDLALPTLWRHEFLNALVKYLRGGHIDLSTAESLWFRAIMLFENYEKPLRQARALEIGLERKVVGYDAQYLALAEDFNAVVITEDKALKIAAPEMCLSMAEWLKQN